LIETQNASLAYGDHGKTVYACEGINIQVRSNEFLGILGPSGSGKSSLLYLMSGLKIPTEGDVLFNGMSLTALGDEARSKLRITQFGFVFQQPYLIGYLTALENVLVSKPDENRVDEAMDLLDELGLSHKTHRHPHELSGGERQRVCVARALLGSPKVIFADEPTAALDHRNGLSVVTLLNKMRSGGSLVMVTHDPSMLTEADRIVRLTDGRLDNLN